MANDMDITGLAIGPVVIARATERKPPTSSDKAWSAAAWIIAIFLVASAAPFLGFILILVSAIVLAAALAPDSKGRNTP